MTKYELIAMRTTLYKLAGTLGTWAEDEHEEDNLCKAYDSIIRTIDHLEKIGYENKWINEDSNEVM